MSRVVCLLSLAGCVVGQSQCVTVTHGTGAQAGDGIHRAQPGDSVTINYAGYLTNGNKFDSSYDRGKPFTTQIGVGQVIQGWDQGVPQLSLGETATLVISASCGYGAQGAPPSIPPNADLIFNVNLLSINGVSASSPTPAPFQAQPAWAAPAPATSFQPLSGVSFASQSSFNSGASTSFQPASSFQPAASSQSVSWQPSSEASVDATPGIVLGGALPAGWWPTPAPPPTASHVGLPTCIPTTCGRAISWDPLSLGQPLCLCNPLCQTMAGTPGVLPCCPGLQEVCLDPWRSPTLPSPTPAPQPALPVATTQALRTSQPVQTVQLQAAQPVQHPAPVQPVQQTVQRPAQPAAQPAAQPVQQRPAQPAQPVQTVQPVKAPTPSLASGSVITSTAIPLSVTPAAAAVAPLTPAVCQFSATKWAPKKTCAEKRWSIRENKCKKVCDAASLTAHAQYWPKTAAGKDACEKALATCHPK